MFGTKNMIVCFGRLACFIGMLGCCEVFAMELDSSIAEGGLRETVEGRNLVYLARNAKARAVKIIYHLLKTLPPGAWKVQVETYGGWGGRNSALAFSLNTKGNIEAVASNALQTQNRQFRNSFFYFVTQSSATKLSLYLTGNREWDSISVGKIVISPASQTWIQDRFYFELDVVNGKTVFPDSFPESVYSINIPGRLKCSWTFSDGGTMTSPANSTQNIYGKLASVTLDKPGLNGTLRGMRVFEKPFDAPAVPPSTPVYDRRRTERGVLELYGDFNGAPALTVYPDNKPIALVTSWDDGSKFDWPLVELLEKYKIKGTLGMNNYSAVLPDIDKLEARGFEIASHSATHPYFPTTSPLRAKLEYEYLRGKLEAKLGHPIVSFIYPFNYGEICDKTGPYVLRGLQNSGFLGARTTSGRRNKTLENTRREFLYGPDFHWSAGPKAHADRLASARKNPPGDFIYTWGHSYELDRGGDKKLEEVLKAISGQADVWYATQGEFSIWCFYHNDL